MADETQTTKAAAKASAANPATTAATTATQAPKQPATARGAVLNLLSSGAITQAENGALNHIHSALNDVRTVIDLAKGMATSKAVVDYLTRLEAAI
jgi:hypothetical protein